MGVGDEQRPVFEDHQAERAHRVPPVAAQHLRDIVQVPAILAKGAADQAVGLVPVYHHRTDCGGVGAHDGASEIGRHAAAAHQLVIGAPIVAVAGVVFRVHQVHVVTQPQRQPVAGNACFDHLGPPDQDGAFGCFLDHGLGGAQHAFVLALGKDDAAGFGLGGLEHRAHQQGGLEHRAVELAFVGLKILHGPRGHACVHRRLGHG